jgi:hypothetical protein
MDGNTRRRCKTASSVITGAAGPSAASMIGQGAYD